MTFSLSPSFEGVDFASVFTEVTHDQTLGLSAGNEELRLFHLEIRNNQFNYTALKDLFMLRLGDFVFSRAKKAQYEVEGKLTSFGHQASLLLRRSENEALKESALGNFMLHTFLEIVLDAPKLLSKIEISEISGIQRIHSDAIHLLHRQNDPVCRANIIFGASNVIGDFGDAVSQALDRAEEIATNGDNECLLVTQNILENNYSPETVEYLKSLLVPSKGHTPQFDYGFGLFIAYDLGLDPQRYGRNEYEEVVAQKMQADIQAHAARIRGEITDRQLGLYPFYIYILPMNNAERDRIDIVNEVL